MSAAHAAPWAPSPGPVPPFGSTAWDYFQAGWPPIPVKPGSKGGPGAIPKGLTGDDGIDLSGAGVIDTCQEKPDHGVALRAPAGCVGIDIDQYDAKRGWENLEALRLEHGLDPLPPTWRSSARPMPSGIRWFRLPAEVSIIDANGEVVDRIPAHEVILDHAPVPGVEMIQRRHRYGMAWPTLHPQLGVPYCWHEDDEKATEEIPKPEELAELPEEWCRALGAHRRDIATPADNGPAEEHREAGWSRRVSKAFDQAATALAEAHEGGRFDCARDGALALIRLEERDDPGSTAALDALRDIYLAATVDTDRDNLGEWNRHVASGREKARRTKARQMSWAELCASDSYIDGLVEHPPPTGTVPAGSPVVDLIPESWRPVDLSPVLAGDHDPPRPEVLRTLDGVEAFFYRGNVNGVHGDPGSGKSWLTLAAIAQVLAAGRRAILLDYEANGSEIVARLLALAVSPEQIRAQLTYLHPGDPLSPLVVAHVLAMVTPETDLVVIDSVGEAFGLDGVDENSDAEVAPWLRLVARPLADAGPAVVLVDHATKAKENPLFPSGSKRKVAAITGSSFLVQAKPAPTRELPGALSLTCAKDRHGTYRKGQVVATVDITPYRDGGVTVNLHRAAPKARGGPDAEVEAIARAVIRLVREEGRSMSRKEIETRLKGTVKASTDAKRGAMDFAIGRGCLSEEPGPRGARLHGYVRDLPTLGEEGE